jgi:hypothetical protein
VGDKDAKELVDGPCKHPRDNYKVHSWGTVCGDCGKKVR